MDKIDLDAIVMKFIEARPHHTKLMIARAVAKEVAHQALVLARDRVTSLYEKQSILDVENLIT